MKQFTCTERPQKHWDYVEDKLISMEVGDTLTLRDDLVEYFCSQGWGTAEGVETAERKPGQHVLSPETVRMLMPVDQPVAVEAATADTGSQTDSSA